MIGKKVPGHGRLPSKILLCGEGPGKNESIQGIPFVGASGADLEFVYLRRAARLRREDIYITNVVKWRTDEEDRDPTAEEILRDEQELMAEVEVCSPEIIVAVGRIAARWFMQTDDVDMEKYVGVPVSCPRYPDKLLLCTYHPAAGLHQPERYFHQIYWAFEQLGRLVRGELGDPFQIWVDNVRAADVHYSDADPSLPLAVAGVSEVAMDTEGSTERPWGLSLAVREREAFVLRGTTDSPAKGSIRDVCCSARVIGHNLLHDIDVLQALGIPINTDRVDDTMLQSYLLPWLPRRLKALSFKLLGVHQNEYEDIIAPAEEKICKDYLQKVLDRRCGLCGGACTIQTAYKRNPQKFKTVKCEACGGDGTSWPAPVPSLLFDDQGDAKLTRPISLGRRVRRILERGTRLREGWSQIDDQLRAPVEEQFGPIAEATLDDIDLQTAVHYSAADADLTLRVAHKLEPMLRQEGLWRVYEIDKGIIPIIHRMHTNGIRIDRGHFDSLRDRFLQESATASSRLSSLSGTSINPSSPLQVAELIYDKLGCKVLKGKRSTDEKTLETLKIKYKADSRVCESVDQITEYRELDKLLGTYVLPLPRAADSNDRIHTRFLLHVVATGRLSSRDPNLQNIPTRTERGRLIRRGFIPRNGCRLVSVDLDQIELRVAAHMSEDPALLEVFTGASTCSINIAKGKCNCHDIHRKTAALIYGKDINDITEQERLLAKTINFLILYGGGAGRLHSELALLGITTTKDQCVQYINDWYNAYPQVRGYIDHCHRAAKSQGYVVDLFGRRRYVQGVWSCVDKVREESLKWATNFPIQATAAGLMKLWMRRVWDNVLPHFWNQGIYCEPLLTIHDELILEAEEDSCEELIRRTVMEAGLAASLLVPIKAKGSHAMTWDALK